MARLTQAQRDALPDSAFAGPNRTCPIHNLDHARAAIGLCADVPGVHAKIEAKYPGLLMHEAGRKKTPQR